MPFYALSSTAEPKIIVEQSEPNGFVLQRGFRYKAPCRVEPFLVPARETTDLASVPWPLWWLIASYGRHTKAALVHDALIDPSVRIRKEDRVSRREADRLFLYALKESGFGADREHRRTSWLRRWVMYVAVAILGTMRKQAPLRLVVFLAHLGAFVVLLTCFVLGRWVEAAWLPLEGWRGLVIVGLAGFLWAFDPCVDTKLGFGLWPAAIFAVVVALPFTLLLAIPWLVFAAGDLVYNVLVSIKLGKWQGAPVVKPTRR